MIDKSTAIFQCYHNVAVRTDDWVEWGDLAEWLSELTDGEWTRLVEIIRFDQTVERRKDQ